MEAKRTTGWILLGALATVALVTGALTAEVTARPNPVLKGKRFKLKAISGSVVVPRGWSAKETADGVALTHPRFSEAAFALGVIQLTPEQQQMRIDSLVWQLASTRLW